MTTEINLTNRYLGINGQAIPPKSPTEYLKSFDKRISLPHLNITATKATALVYGHNSRAASIRKVEATAASILPLRRSCHGKNDIPTAPPEQFRGGVPKVEEEEVIEINTSNLWQKKGPYNVILENTAPGRIPKELITTFKFVLNIFLEKSRNKNKAAFEIVKKHPNVFSELHKYHFYPSQHQKKTSLLELVDLYFSNSEVYSRYGDLSEHTKEIIGAIYYAPMIYFIYPQESAQLKNPLLINAMKILQNEKIKKTVKKYLNNCNFDIFKYRANKICEIEIFMKRDSNKIFSGAKQKLKIFNNAEDLINL